MAFAEQVAAFADFLHQLFQRNALPPAGAARAHALERGQHAVRCGLVRQHGRAAGAAGGAPFQAVVAAQHGIDLAHRGFHGRGVGGGQRVVGVAGNAQDLVAGAVHAQAHTALGPAAQAGRGADHLAGLGAQLAGGGVDAEFRGQRVAARGAGRAGAGGAGHQALGAAGQGFAIAGGKGGQATGHGPATQQQAAAGGIGLFGVCGGMLFVGHGLPLQLQRRQAPASRAICFDSCWRPSILGEMPIG